MQYLKSYAQAVHRVRFLHVELMAYRAGALLFFYVLHSEMVEMIEGGVLICSQ